MADIIDVNIGDQVLEVFWQDEVELNLDMDLMYIKSGQKEIQDYVDNVSKPEINSYIETETKPIVTEVVNTIAEPLVNEYMEGTVKPDIDTYTNEKLESFNTNAATLLAEYNANATEKTDAFNTNASEKQALVDASVAAATAQAGIATTKASEASSSATAASNYASNASADAGNAAESAGLAANSAAEAAESEGKAAEYLQQIGNKIISVEGSIGDIGFAPLGIDEAQNKRRYLNGQVISQSQFVSFTNKIKSAIQLYPSLATSETNWQAEVTNSKLGQCGKFVIDDTLGTIRLPKVININGLQDLALMGGIKAESLPNITGKFGGFGTWGGSAVTMTGALSESTSSYQGGIGVASSPFYTNNLDFKASNSSSTYQDNAPVQQEAVQYPYFIQVATGVEESVDVTREIELNNPFSLLDYKWSEYELSNTSWLLSNGQFNSGATYPSVYELLLKIHNGTETKDGVSVKLSTEAYTDTDFVINTANTTFRLPIKVKLASGNRVVGNGMTLGFTDGTNNLALKSNSTDGVEDDKALYGKSAGTTSSSAGTGVNTAGLGITTDPTKSGIETSSSGLKLYFYVGETIQDANVIAASQVLTDVANLKAHSIVETYVNGTSWYRVYSDGWCEQGGYSTSSNVIITLLKTYANTNYTITLGKAFNIETNTRFPNIVSTTKTTAQFKVTGTYNNTTGTDCYFYWETKGYIA